MTLGQATESGSFFKGQISDVRLYDYMLTVGEIATLCCPKSIGNYTITPSGNSDSIKSH